MRANLVPFACKFGSICAQSALGATRSHFTQAYARSFTTSSHAPLLIGAAQLQQWLGIGHPLKRHPFARKFGSTCVQIGSICVQIGSICVQIGSICAQKWFHRRGRGAEEVRERRRRGGGEGCFHFAPSASILHRPASILHRPASILHRLLPFCTVCFHFAPFASILH